MRGRRRQSDVAPGLLVAKGDEEEKRRDDVEEELMVLLSDDAILGGSVEELWIGWSSSKPRRASGFWIYTG